MTTSTDTLLSAPVATTPATHTEGSHPEKRSPTSARASYLSYCSDNDRGSSKQQGRRSIPVFRPHSCYNRPEGPVPPKIMANWYFNAHQPGVDTQSCLDKSPDLGKVQADGLASRSTARRKPSEENMEATPATAIHRSKDADTITIQRRSTDKDNGVDPFLGTGRPMRRSSVNSVTMRMPDNLHSPSPTPLRSSQLGGTPGLLDLHDAHSEVLSLLDGLKATHREQTKSEVDAALKRCQEDLKARSKDKNIGTSESNILDREAARIGRARDEAGRQTPEADGAPSAPADAVSEDSLRLALKRLLEDARAALEAGTRAESQAAAALRANGGYIPYRAGEDFHLAALSLKHRTLVEEMESLQAENEQVRRENSDLQGKLDELMGRGRDEPLPAKLGPWGKEWNIDSRRGG